MKLLFALSLTIPVMMMRRRRRRRTTTMVVVYAAVQPRKTEHCLFFNIIPEFA
jgi:hypothetical protein